jgi:hypothetical protein
MPQAAAAVGAAAAALGTAFVAALPTLLVNVGFSFQDAGVEWVCPLVVKEGKAP